MRKHILRSLLVTSLLTASLITGCQSSVEDINYNTLDGTAKFLKEITIANYAPSSEEQFESAYKKCKNIMSDSLRASVFDYDVKKDLLLLGVAVRDIDVYFSNYGTENEVVYRVDLELGSREDITELEVYYYMLEDGTIGNVVSVKGGTPKV